MSRQFDAGEIYILKFTKFEHDTKDFSNYAINESISPQQFILEHVWMGLHEGFTFDECILIIFKNYVLFFSSWPS